MRARSERHVRFIEEVQAHQGAVRKIVALYAREPADREDLLQEILLQLWRSYESFRGESAFSTFLYRVALNTALTRVRRGSRRPALDEEFEVEELESAAATRDDEDVERLYAAIRELGAVDRAVTLLVLEEKTHAEIAAITGLSVGNVSVRLSRSKQKLRRLLGGGETPRKGTPCSTKT